MRRLLTDTQAARALELYRDRVSADEIAAGLGVSALVVNNILAGRTYRNVPGVRAGARKGGRRPRIVAADVAEVRRLRDEEGLGPAALAHRFGCPIRTIADILHGRYTG